MTSRRAQVSPARDGAAGAVASAGAPVAPPRGVLRGSSADGLFTHDRLPPHPDIAAFVEHFWTVAWDVPGAPVTSEVLSHPSVHIVFEHGSSRVVGVPRAKFTRRLEGRGFVVGIKFRPGWFRPLIDHPVSRLTDRTVALGAVLGERSDALAAAVLAAPTTAARVGVATEFLRGWLPAPDPIAAHASQIVKRILDDRRIRKVDDVAQIFDTSPRALQRLFHDHVGVSPKWVIRRYRMHEVLERMDAGTPIDWAALALDLCYFDQAHFSRDFKNLVGRTPTGYVLAALRTPARRATASPPRPLRARRRVRAARPRAPARSPG
jgi:AraC-like DNA-binding protein